jgi:hypothetical protein
MKIILPLVGLIFATTIILGCLLVGVLLWAGYVTPASVAPLGMMLSPLGSNSFTLYLYWSANLLALLVGYKIQTSNIRYGGLLFFFFYVLLMALMLYFGHMR